MILVIDNYDSFTYNLVQYFQELGREVIVRRNDKIRISEITSFQPEAIVISPGPGGPESAGISMQIIREYGSSMPILGVCLGHQAIGAVYGARIVRSEKLMHGKTSPIFTNGDRLFDGMPKPFEACRYHSLIVSENGFPESLKIIGKSDHDEIMALRHKDYPVFGVQFHPESILTLNGKHILSNFLEIVEHYHDHGTTELQRDSSAMPQTQDESAAILKRFIHEISSGRNLSQDDMEAAMRIIMSGQATHAQMGAFLMALKMKGETVAEITGAAKVMREKAHKLQIKRNGAPLLDTCGTGGDGAKTFNISTTTAFILAGAGVLVAKHGNRSVSSSCGSADVLRALGADLEIPPDAVQKCIEETGFGFLFAPSFHSAMKHAALPRQEVGVRTIFNVLGPLTNPASASCQLLGVYDPDLTEPLAEALKSLGVIDAMVVHGLEGLDEISLCGPTKISHLHNGQVDTFIFNPEDYGLTLCSKEDLSGGDAIENADHLRRILQGIGGPRREIALLNAAAAFIVTGKAKDFPEGLALAAESIDSGAALKKLNQYINFKAQ